MIFLEGNRILYHLWRRLLVPCRAVYFFISLISRLKYACNSAPMKYTIVIDKWLLDLLHAKTMVTKNKITKKQYTPQNHWESNWMSEWVSASMRKINIERDFVVARVLNLFRYVRVYLATSTSMDQIFQHHWRALCSDSLLSTILVGCCFCCFCCFCTDNNVVVVVLKWYAIADGAYLVIFRNW